MKRWKKRLRAISEKVSPEIVYQEMYEELRRFRDYELTVSTWYTVILLAIGGSIFAIRNSESKTPMYIMFSEHCFVKLLFLILILVIAANNIISICYSRKRYKQLRKYVNHLEPYWKQFKPEKISLKPHHLIIILQILLVAIFSLMIFLP